MKKNDNNFRHGFHGFHDLVRLRRSNQPEGDRSVPKYLSVFSPAGMGYAEFINLIIEGTGADP